MAPVSVTLVGVGLVGKQIVNQLCLPHLSNMLRIDVLANSTYQASIDDKFSNRKDAESLLAALPPSSTSAAEAEAKAKSTPGVSISAQSLADLVTAEIAKNIAPNASNGRRPQLFIDSTSDNGVAALYPQLLRAGISIVTPNKKAFSANQQLYDEISNAAYPNNPTGGLVYKESTVGAGLPIISTLDDLIKTGDQVTQIAGVFSGTLSYIFNNFAPAVPSSEPVSFSSIVSKAKELGYTEPHPGDDLNGSDVARKLTILARSLNLKLQDGFESVPTESLIPDSLKDIQSGQEFVSKLPEFDAQFAKRANQNPDKVLRYVGLIDLKSNTIKCGLEPYARDHPFAASLSGSDNIISFQSQRYNSTPLIVQGPGAGADVTAMGVVADAIRVAERL